MGYGAARRPFVASDGIDGVCADHNLRKNVLNINVYLVHECPPSPQINASHLTAVTSKSMQFVYALIQKSKVNVCRNYAGYLILFIK